jgi:dCTP deaminase
MFLNGKQLVEAKPIYNMVTSKMKYSGTSYGLSEAGYDIRIKQNITFKPGIFNNQITISDDYTYRVIKGNFVLASAIELFDMPKNLVGNVKDKSTWARKGLSVFNTVIEPGWKGYLTLELVFNGNEEVVIKKGQGIAQVLFGLLSEDGDYKNGKYQNQENKPIGSRT